MGHAQGDPTDTEPSGHATDTEPSEAAGADDTASVVVGGDGMAQIVALLREQNQMQQAHNQLLASQLGALQARLDALTPPAHVHESRSPSHAADAQAI